MMQRYLFKTLLLIAFFGVTPAFAQQSPEVPMNAPAGTVVATVNIQDARIVSQQGNTLTIAFSLTNRERLQAGVQYGVSLVSEGVDGRQTVAHEMVYTEVLTLPEHSTTVKEIVYIAPAMLSGTYTVLLNSKNESGFPFGVTVAGIATFLASENGLVIDSSSCFSQVEGESEQYSLFRSVQLLDKNVLRIVCTATNTSAVPLTVSPIFTTQYNSVYGETVSLPEAKNTFIFEAGKTKSFSVLVPIVRTPQSYVVTVALKGEGVTSNAVTAHYSIPGATAMIANATLDKDFYAKGETATISVLWAGTLPGVTLSASLVADTGRACAKPYTQALMVDTNLPFTEIVVPITASCFNPTLMLSVKDENDTVLDMRNFSFATTSTSRPLVPWKAAAVVVGVIIVIVVGRILIKNRHQYDNLS